MSIQWRAHRSPYSGRSSNRSIRALQATFETVPFCPSGPPSDAIASCNSSGVGGIPNRSNQALRTSTLGSAISEGVRSFASCAARIKASTGCAPDAGRIESKGWRDQNFRPDSRSIPFCLTGSAARLGSTAPCATHRSKSSMMLADNLPEGGISYSSYRSALRIKLSSECSELRAGPVSPPRSIPSLLSRYKPPLSLPLVAASWEWHE